MTRLALLAALALTLGCVGPKRQSRAVARIELGNAYLMEGDPSSAIGTLREAVKLDPRNPTGWHKLALAYMAHDANTESEDAFDRSLHLAPEDAEVLNNYGLLMLRLERNDEAIVAFEEALRDLTYRKPALVLNNLGWALYEQDRFDDALLRLNEAVRRAPNLCQARFHRGLVHQALGHLPQSLDDFEGVIDLCGDATPGAYYHAAEVLQAMGETARADTYLQTAARLAPGTELATAAKSLSGGGR